MQGEPIFLICVGVLSALVFYFRQISISYFLVTVFLLILVYMLSKKKFLLMILIGSLAGYIYCVLYSSCFISDLNAFIGKKNIFLGEVISDIETNSLYEKRYYLKLERVIGHKFKFYKSPVLLVKAPYYEISMPGDLIQISGVLVKPKDAVLPGLFSEKKYLYSKEVFYIIKADKGSHVFLDEPPGGIFNRYIYKIRNYIINSSFKYLSPENQILMRGIVFGSKASKLKDELKNKIQDLGLNHITSASGFNVAILAGAVFYLFNILRMPKIYLTLISVVFILFYTMLADFSSSVIRAAIFLIFLFLGNLFNKKIKILSVTSAIFLMFFVFSPFQVLDVGLQLSIVAFLALVFYGSKIRDLLSGLKNKFCFYFIDLVFQSAIIQIVIIPLVVFYFHNIQLLAVPANIVAVPLAGFLLIVGITSVFLDTVIHCDILSKIICFMIQCASDLFLFWVDWLYKFPLKVFYLPAINFWILLWIYILTISILYILFFCKFNKKITFLICLNIFLIIVFSGSFNLNKDLKIFFIPRYNHELILILLPDSKPVVFLSLESAKNINFVKQFFKINNISPAFTTCILKNKSCSLNTNYFESDETMISLKYKKFSMRIIKNYKEPITSSDTCIRLPILMKKDPALRTVIKSTPEILIINDYKKLSKRSIENIKWINKQPWEKYYLSMSGTVTLVTDGLKYNIKDSN